MSEIKNRKMKLSVMGFRGLWEKLGRSVLSHQGPKGAVCFDVCVLRALGLTLSPPKLLNRNRGIGSGHASLPPHSALSPLSLSISPSLPLSPALFSAPFFHWRFFSPVSF